MSYPQGVIWWWSTVHWVMALARWVRHSQGFNFQRAGLLLWRGVLYSKPQSLLKLAKCYLVSKPNGQVKGKGKIEWKHQKIKVHNLNVQMGWSHEWSISDITPPPQYRLYRPLKWEEPASSQCFWDWWVKALMAKDTDCIMLRHEQHDKAAFDIFVQDVNV